MIDISDNTLQIADITFTDITTFSDTFPPWVNIPNDRAHLQEECPGRNAVISR